MSKSAPKDDKGTIFMLDDIEITRKKIMSACTDSEGKVYYDEDNKPGISNLISLVCVVNNMTIEEARKAAVESVRKLAIDVGIPQRLTDIGARKEDIEALSELAIADACTPGNPKDPTIEDIKNIYEKAF
jgi:alcohol dehydrogenase class IV